MEHHSAGGSVSVRAILFDIGDTLFRLNPMEPVHAEVAESLTRLAGISPEAAAEAATSAIQSHHEEAIAAWEEGLTAEPPLDAVLFRHFEPHVRLTPMAAEALAEIFWRADIARFEAGPDCASRVAAFRKAGYRLAVVSNTSTRSSLLDGYLTSAGLLPLFETAVYSTDLGVRKPHPEIYREALRRLDLRPEDVLFVGDRVREDVRGPQSVGIRAVLSHEFRQEDPGESRPLAIVQRLDELQRVIDSCS